MPAAPPKRKLELNRWHAIRDTFGFHVSQYVLAVGFSAYKWEAGLKKNVVGVVCIFVREKP